ncbi:MAG: hypothetical protein CVU44_19735 [Chloroflexi bacterium HGW-Chloroflexi-6]|nr:MAG: hypothetical protein CVU44_19735 [Chloroflexi bacterium HGW-Chloroflexi-6]
MTQWLSKLLDRASEYFAHRKGLLPLVGILLVFINLVLAIFLPAGSMLVTSNLFLHLGIIVALFGLMLSWAL